MNFQVTKFWKRRSCQMQQDIECQGIHYRVYITIVSFYSLTISQTVIVVWKEFIAKNNLCEHLSRFFFCSIYMNVCGDYRIKDKHACCNLIYWSNSILDKKLHLTVNCTHKLFLATKSTYIHCQQCIERC